MGDNSVEITKQGPIDIFLREIQPGDVVVYATRRGSKTYLNKLKVTEVHEDKVLGWNPEDVTRRLRQLTNFETVAKVY